MLEFVEQQQPLANGAVHVTEDGPTVRQSDGLTVATPDDLRIDTLAPGQLHAFWPFLKRGLLDILRKLKVAPDWIPEDVYAFVRHGDAVAYLVFHHGRYVAFMVCYLNPLPFSGQKELIAWCGWAIPVKERYPNDDQDRVWRMMFDLMRDTGRRAGAIRLATLTTRPGMAKQAAKVGLIPSFTRYECTL